MRRFGYLAEYRIGWLFARGGFSSSIVDTEAKTIARRPAVGEGCRREMECVCRDGER